jgi:hypothetical protein
MIYLRCFAYEMVMRLIAWAVLSPIERSRVDLGDTYARPHPLLEWLYGRMDSIYGRAWEALWDIRPELEEALSNRFPETLLAERGEYRCGLCR